MYVRTTHLVIAKVPYSHSLYIKSIRIVVSLSTIDFSSYLCSVYVWPAGGANVQKSCPVEMCEYIIIYHLFSLYYLYFVSENLAFIQRSRIILGP